jgi:ATP-dependent exoDNAse (exonuclease V) alpha subunit
MENIISNEQIKKDTEKELSSLKVEKIKITDKVLKLNSNINKKYEIVEKIKYKKIGEDTFVFPNELVGSTITIKEESILEFIDLNINFESFQRQKISSINNDEIPDTLDEYQKDAFKKCIEFNYTLVFGPPGSGKSHTIRAIVEKLIEKENNKIYITSISNLAVDNILEKLDSKVKVGKILTGYEDNVNEYRTQLEELAKEKTNLELQLLFFQKNEYLNLKKEIEEIEKEIEDLRIEKVKIENSFLSFLKKGKVAELQERINIKTEKLNDRKEKLKELEKEIEKLERNLAEIKKNVVFDEKYKTKEDVIKTIEEVDSQIASINRRISFIKRETPVIGITLYSLLKMVRDQKINLNDATVIIDEASQIPYPIICYIRTLAKRTIVVGDPNQLQPITNSGVFSIFEYEKTHAELKRVRRFKSFVGKIVKPFYDREIEVIVEGGRVNLIDPEEIETLAKMMEEKGEDYIIATPYVERKKYFSEKGFKADTIHALQGKEFKNVIFDIPKDSQFINRNMVIVAMTRTKENLFIAIPENIRKSKEIRNPYIRKLVETLKAEKVKILKLNKAA